MRYYSTKTYGNDRGFSTCFRQHGAESHCSLLHGYSLGFKFVFSADQLDHRNWVYDFGDTKWIKSFLEENFDHTLVVAYDDPFINELFELEKLGVARIVFLPAVGCEMFAKYVYEYVTEHIRERTEGRVELVSVEVFEHGANSAIYSME